MQEVSQLVLPRDAQILHFDLDDFFNCGTLEFLVKSSADNLFVKQRALASEICRFLLDHQYVRTDTDDEHVWKVSLGSGQGLTASAAVANSVFTSSTEMNGAQLCRSSMHSSMGVLFYRRYVDNLFFIVNNAECVPALLAYIRSRMLVYTGKVEDQLVDTFDFLDCSYDIIRDHSTARITPRPLLKLNSHFLSTRSAHPWAIHVAWPLA